MRKTILMGLALAMTTPSAVQAAPAPVAAAVAAKGQRTEANLKLDDSRQPAAVLKFLGLQRGAKVLDLFGGNLYWAEIVAPSVGPKGRVTIWEPSQFYDDKGKAAFAAFDERYPNVRLISSPMEQPMIPAASYDFALFNLDYHDIYWTSDKYGVKRMEPDAWLAALYAAMRPGATVGVIDHAATPGGDTRAVVDALHRIDPAVVRADFERAGFVFVGQSNLLANPADDHSLNVFDAKIRGKTDRFLFKFQKPKA